MIKAFIFSIGIIFSILCNTNVILSEPLEIDITQGKIEPVPIAISNFFSENTRSLNLGKEITEVVKNNLENSGLFKNLNPKAFLQPPQELIQRPDFRDWRIIDAQILVEGSIYSDENKIKLEVQLWDVYGERRMLGLSLSSKKDNWRRIAHILSDKIYERITGEPGYFNSRIAYIAENGPPDKRIKRLAIMDQDGANQSFLTDGKDLVLTPRFSPMGNKIAYFSYQGNTPSVRVYDIEKNEDSVVGSFKGMTFAPRFSPNGKLVAMSLARGGSTNIYLYSLIEKTLKRLTKGRAIDTSPSFSPDGSSLVFNSDRSGKQSLYIMDSMGKNIKRISFGRGRYATPVWSPRGDYIAFTKFVGGIFYIGLMKPNGSGERLIAKGYLTEGPTWAPNGRILAFYRSEPRSNGSEEVRIFTIDITGTRERILPTLHEASDPSWGPSVDG